MKTKFNYAKAAKEVGFFIMLYGVIFFIAYEVGGIGHGWPLFIIVTVSIMVNIAIARRVWLNYKPHRRDKKFRPYFLRIRQGRIVC